MQTAAAYIRVSTEDQTEYSPESQKKRIREYASSHQLNLPDYYIYTDEGISGRSASKRPAFQEMIRTAKQKPRPFDCILVWKFSRFARNRQDSIFYKTLLRRDCGVDVISITEQLSPDPTSILIEALLEAMDEYYSINLAQEVRRGITEKYSRGGVTSPPPFGYRMGNDEFEPDTSRALLVPALFQKYRDGQTLRELCRWLSEMGVCTRRGNPFSPRTLRYLLSNPVYLGLHRMRGNPEVPGNHPPLISRELFLQVQDKLAQSRNRYAPQNSSAGSAYMLQGLARCSFCGSVLTKSSHHSLQCSRYAHGLCPESHSVSLPLFRQTVLKALEEDFSGCSFSFPLFPPKGQTAGNPYAGASRLEKQLARIEAAYESGIDTLEEYARKKQEWLRRQEAFRNEKSRQISFSEEKKICLPANILWQWFREDLISPRLQNRLLSCILSSVVFDRKSSSVCLHYRT